MKNILRIISLFAFLYLANCSCSGSNNTTDLEHVYDMGQQINIKPQEEGVRVSPKNSRARNRIYYPYKTAKEAGESMTNYLKPTKDVILQGENLYKKYCIYCHGQKGDGGEGATVAPKMQIQPPSLLTQKVQDYPDGWIYHILHEGQGLMGSYRIQLVTNEQVLNDKKVKTSKYVGWKSIWSLIHYIRVLQKSQRK